MVGDDSVWKVTESSAENPCSGDVRAGRVQLRAEDVRYIWFKGFLLFSFLLLGDRSCPCKRISRGLVEDNAPGVRNHGRERVVGGWRSSGITALNGGVMSDRPPLEV